MRYGFFPRPLAAALMFMALAAPLAVPLASPLAAQEAPARAAPAAPVPAQARDGVVRVGPENVATAFSGAQGLVRVEFAAPGAPVPPPVGEKLNGPAQQMLRRLYAAGRAAGNLGDLYENRDRGHSALRAAYYPQLTRVVYSRAARAQGLDYGLALRLVYDAPLIGNSSTALTKGVFWRSLPRLGLTRGKGMGGDASWPYRLYQNYAAGQIHVYPEHRDHDPERGDLFPANTPYYLISQGSSGSDRPHLAALAMILAALRPETKAKLRETGLIAPTVQMVYRRARVGVRSRRAYLSGAAHPTVFRERDISLERMVGLANAITPETVPPMVRLRVQQETRAREGTDFYGQGLGEVLFDTPSAIARVWRSRAGSRSMVVSAGDTRDPNGRALRFEWVLLRGDPERVTITPLDGEGRRARIDMQWQEPRAAPGSPDTLSPRIDIGVFADNGAYLSAPAFVSVLLPRHETRVYDTGPDGTLRVASIDRQAPKGVYADPAIFPDTPWRDVYHYDAGGRMTGWTRYVRGGPFEYDASGARILERDGQGNAVRLAPVRYLYEEGALRKRPRLREEVLAPVDAAASR